MSRASYEQVEAIIQFMTAHPMLAMGQNKTVEDRFESKGLWQKVAAKLNAINGARKTPKGWSKYWADKKCNVRKMAMIHDNGTDMLPPSFSPLDEKILDLVGRRDKRIYNRLKPRVKHEMAEVSVDEQDGGDGDADGDEEGEEEREVDYEQVDKPIEFVTRPLGDMDEERHAALMDKMLQIMSDQSSALAKIAESSATNARALARLADSSQQRTAALEQIAGSVARLAASFGDACESIARIDSTVQRAFPNLD